MDFVLALHSHLPYVLNHGRWPHGSDWLSEATFECYLPLLEVAHRLRPPSGMPIRDRKTDYGAVDSERSKRVIVGVSGGIAAYKAPKQVFLVDDNFIGNKKLAKELLRAIAQKSGGAYFAASRPGGDSASSRLSVPEAIAR